MIINSRKDLAAAPSDVRDQFMARLAAGINRWSWQDGDWTLLQDTATIERFGFAISDFPDAPVPDKPDWNQDERDLEQARQAAELSRSLFKLALLDAGFLDDVQAFVASADDQRIKIMWEDSGSFRRMHPDLIRLAAELGYTDEQLDAVFGIGG